MKQLRFDFGLLAVVAVGTVGLLGHHRPGFGQSDVEQAINFPLPPTTATEETFTTFESGQVRPLAMSPDGHFLYRGQHAGQPARDLPRRRRTACRTWLGDGRSRARRGRGAQRRRGLGRQPPVRQRQRRRREPATRARVVRTLLVGDEPRDIVFAREPRLSSRPRIAARTPVEIRSSRPLGRPCGRLGLRSRCARHDADRHAGDGHHAVRRYAARARGIGRREHRLRRGVSLRQPDHRGQRAARDEQRIRTAAEHQRGRSSGSAGAAWSSSSARARWTDSFTGSTS